MLVEAFLAAMVALLAVAGEAPAKPEKKAVPAQTKTIEEEITIQPGSSTFSVSCPPGYASAGYLIDNTLESSGLLTWDEAGWEASGRFVGRVTNHTASPLKLRVGNRCVKLKVKGKAGGVGFVAQFFDPLVKVTSIPLESFAEVGQTEASCDQKQVPIGWGGNPAGLTVGSPLEYVYSALFTGLGIVYGVQNQSSDPERVALDTACLPKKAKAKPRGKRRRKARGGTFRGRQAEAEGKAAGGGRPAAVPGAPDQERRDGRAACELPQEALGDLVRFRFHDRHRATELGHALAPGGVRKAQRHRAGAQLRSGSLPRRDEPAWR